MSLHAINEGARTSMSGTQVFSNVESAATCSWHVPSGDVVAINPFLSLANSVRHSTRPANLVVVWVVVGVEVCVVVDEVVVTEVVVVVTVVVVVVVVEVVVVVTLVVVLVMLVVVLESVVVVDVPMRMWERMREGL